MRWVGRRESTNVEDRRGQFPVGRGAGLGCGGLLLLLVLAWLTGADPQQLLSLLGGLQQSAPPAREQAPPAGAPQDQLGKFAAVVLADTEETWNRIFRETGGRYEEPKMVLFSRAVASACGYASSAAGPFYCPGDRKLYLDLAFFDELDRRFGAPGDFAQAYVIAHEVGHHVQNLLGISERVHALQERARSKEEANALSVRLELQADCFAGVWGNTANRDRRLLEPGDLEEGLAAAAAIGDDTIQRGARGYVTPETWTHGSSEMRSQWFRRGLQSGDPTVCDTFKSR
jgi:predicted metalloprotease